MQPNPVIVQPDSTIGELLLMMNHQRIGSVLVCRGRRLIGIFTERDLLRRVSDAVLGWRNYAVTEWMTPQPHTIAPDTGWEDAVQEMTTFGIRHLPVVERGEVVGMLSTRMLMARRAEYLDAAVEGRTNDLRAVNEELLARDSEMNHNMRTAGRLQKKLLPPQPPNVPELRWAIHYAPLDDLGGDYYGYADPDANHLGMFIADASGHSIPAALVAIMTRYAFADVARTTIHPGEMLTKLNRRLCDITEERFVSAFYGVLDKRTGVLKYANAGHPYPLHRHGSTGEVKPLNAQGFLLGIIPEEVYQEREVRLEPEDSLLFYTDGLIEARNEIGEQFGTERLTECLLHRRSSPEADVEEIIAQQRNFSGKEPLCDDLTIVACHRLGAG